MNQDTIHIIWHKYDGSTLVIIKGTLKNDKWFSFLNPGRHDCNERRDYQKPFLSASFYHLFYAKIVISFIYHNSVAIFLYRFCANIIFPWMIGSFISMIDIKSELIQSLEYDDQIYFYVVYIYILVTDRWSINW